MRSDAKHNSTQSDNKDELSEDQRIGTEPRPLSALLSDATLQKLQELLAKHMQLAGAETGDDLIEARAAAKEFEAFMGKLSHEQLEALRNSESTSPRRDLLLQNAIQRELKERAWKQIAIQSNHDTD